MASSWRGTRTLWACAIGLGIGACGGADATVGDATQADPVTTAPPPVVEGPPAPGIPTLPSTPATPVPPVDATPMGWAVDSDGALLHFRLDDPSKVESTPIRGVFDGERIVGIDFRPATKSLYALGSKSHIYTLALDTGAASVVSPIAFAPALAGRSFGFDFNPVVDRIRVHSDFDQNLRLDPRDGTLTAKDGTLAFAATDVNAGQSPNVVATAYTNSVSPAPKTTVLFGLDSTRNLLVKVPNANDGQLVTVGPLGVDVEDAAGFDIRGADGALEAYAALSVGDVVGLYTIDLERGGAKLVAPIQHDKPIESFAVSP